MSPPGSQTIAGGVAARHRHRMSVLVRDSIPADVPATTAIYGHAVLYGNASFELDPPDAMEIARRFPMRTSVRKRLKGLSPADVERR